MSAQSGSRSQPGSGRRVLFFGVMLLIPLLFLLAAGELALRVQRAQRLAAAGEMAAVFEAMFRWDAVIGALHEPNAEMTLSWPEAADGEIRFATNDMGFREDAPTERQPEARRVIVLGDSHTEGFVDNAKTLPNVAEALLRSEGVEIEVINAGTSTHSLFAEYLHLKRLLDLDPDHVVFVAYTGNDFEEIIAPERAHIAFASGRPVERPAGETSRLPAVYEKLADLIRAEYEGPILVLDWLRARLGGGHATEPLPREEIVGILAQGMSQARTLGRDPRLFEQAARANDYVIGEIVDLTAEHGIDLSFIILPTKYQVERDRDVHRFRTFEEIYGLDPSDPVEGRVGAEMIRSLEARGVEHLDALPHLVERGRASGEEYYYRADHHLNASGSAVVGELLAEMLRPARTPPESRP